MDSNNKDESVTNILTIDAVAQHNNVDDCWVTAGNNVYNVTPYIKSHPGGQENITKYCGADITAAFFGRGHSMNAKNILASYKIGTLDPKSIPASTNSKKNTNNDNDRYQENY